MKRSSLVAALAAAVLFGPVGASYAEDEPTRELLPFSRQIAVGGTIADSFEASIAAAGVPAPAMVEALQAFAISIDFGRDVKDGDRFHVRYERTFIAEDVPIGPGRVLWAELQTAAKGTIAIHRFRTRDGADHFWSANGQAAMAPAIRLPVEVVSISSGFGLRADPFDQPPPPPTAGKSGAMGGPLRTPPALPPGLKPGTITGETPLASSGGSSSYGRSPARPSPYGNWQQAPRAGRSLFMHEGVDLVAPTGTPVHAAADGVVFGAAPNGRYGNWIRIDHAGKLATVYGHLSAFAPGIAPGAKVSRGELIGFVGSTGRSTAPHLHFELLIDGRPVNPITHPEVKRSQMRSPDLERFRKQVTQSLAERDRETALAASYSR
ncbi:M23 family metallopeptidase [Reyranella sp.]|uniref:M23 family metallopeptidase n=1 Tax=Reyranella sp. TaxID=1929291 RepID=UPI002731352C|nr:M23 family metallopeptidase [Reyranella sp.]MDP2374835.1 peptidoglycan DD-metalloendopeptidase family protein [Reyranella sp.]